MQQNSLKTTDQTVIQAETAKLAEKLSLTNYNDEDELPYILTSQEEEERFYHAVQTEKERIRFNFSAKVWEGEVEAKLQSIDWDTFFDKKQLFKVANERKHHLLWEKEQREKERIAENVLRNEIKEKCNAKYFYNLMRSNFSLAYPNKLFEQDVGNMILIKAICFFMSNDERFESELGMDLNKGILVRGISGLGKTLLFKLVAENPLNPIEIISMITVARSIKNEGEYNLNWSKDKIIYLDDVGTETNVVNHFGTKINWFKDTMETLYMEPQLFNRSIISTNCSHNELEDNYGFRVRSRFKEMYNVINLSGNDRRK